MTTLADMVQRAETSLSSGLADFRSTGALFMLSDYGGEHQLATHLVASFLLLNPTSLEEWDDEWRPLRRRLLPDRRRIAFKRLADEHRAGALAGFLAASERIEGLLFTLAVNRRAPRLFESIDTAIGAPELAWLKTWKAKPLRKALLSIHVASLLLAGLGANGQDVWWFTDEDEIAPNRTRLTDVCEMFARISSHYLSHDMGHFKFGTASSDDGSRRLEDLLALPDLAAGAVTEVLRSYWEADVILEPGLALALPDSVSRKSRLLVPWLATSHARLRKLVFALEPGLTGAGTVVRRLSLHALA